MMLQVDTTEDAERKILEILRIIYESPQPIGSAIIAKKLENNGISLGERSIRLYLKITDSRNFTRLVGREGRCITPAGVKEFKTARISGRAGDIYHKLELLSFLTTLDLNTNAGQIPVNTTLIHNKDYPKAIRILKEVTKSSLGVSNLMLIVGEGQNLGGITVPKGETGIATISCVAVTGILLKAGVPIDFQSAGILEVADFKPKRFIATVEYKNTSLNPSEQFIRSGMTSVNDAVHTGSGNVLTLFCTTPAPAAPIIEHKNTVMKKSGFNGIYCMGNTSSPVCHVNVGLNRMGMILLSGLNPIAAVVEAGIDVENLDSINLVDFTLLKPFGK